MAADNGSIVVLLDELELVARETTLREVDVTLEDASLSSSVVLPVFIDVDKFLEDAIGFSSNYVEVDVLLEDVEVDNPIIAELNILLEDSDLEGDLDVTGTKLDIRLTDATLESVLEISGVSLAQTLENASLEALVTVTGGMLIQTLEPFELSASLQGRLGLVLDKNLENVSADIEARNPVATSVEALLGDISYFASDVFIPVKAEGLSSFKDISSDIVGTKIVAGEANIEFGDTKAIAKGYNLTGNLSPYQQIVTWSGHPATGQSVKTRLGNLKGITGQEEFGLFASSGWNLNTNGLIHDDLNEFSIDDIESYLIAGTKGIRLYNADLTLFDGGTPSVKLDHEVPSIALGNPISESFLGEGANTGIWMGKALNDDGITYSYKFRVGSPNNNEESLRWTGGALEIRGADFTQFGPDGQAVIKLDPTVPSLAIGKTVPTAFSDTNPGLWTGLVDDGGEKKFKFRLGDSEGARIEWELGKLNLFGTSLKFTGVEGSIVLTHDSLEKISATKFTGSGIYLDSEGIFGVNNDVLQAYMSAATGEIVAAESIFLNADGISMLGGQFTVGQATSFLEGNGVWIGLLPSDLLVTYETGNFIYTTGATVDEVNGLEDWAGDERQLALGGGFGFRIGDPTGDRLEWDGASLNLFAPVVNLIESTTVGNPHLYFKEIGGSPILSLSSQVVTTLGAEALIGEILVSDDYNTENTTNYPKQLLISAADNIDFSTASLTLNGSSIATVDADHGQLSGLEDDDHPQYSMAGFDYNSEALLYLPFDGTTPLETNFDVNIGSGSPTGSVIGKEGKFDKAVQIAEATTNFVTNPSFESDTSPWVLDRVTLTRVTDDSKFGNYSALVTKTTAETYNEFSFNHPVSGDTLGRTFTASCWVKAPTVDAVGKEVGIWWEIVRTAGTRWSGPYTIELTEEWQRLERTIYLINSDAINIIPHIYPNLTDTELTSVLVDGFQLEEKPNATPYCDGSLGTGHSWSGTAHASASSRVSATLSYAKGGNINDTTGTISLWLRPAFGAYDYTVAEIVLSDSVILDMGVPELYFSADEEFVFYDGLNYISTPAKPLFSAGSNIHLAVTWESGGKTILYVNGIPEASADYNPLTTSTNFYIGSRADNTSHANSLIDDFASFDRALTLREIKSIADSTHSLSQPVGLKRELEHGWLVGLGDNDHPQYAPPEWVPFTPIIEYWGGTTDPLGVLYLDAYYSKDGSKVDYVINVDIDVGTGDRETVVFYLPLEPSWEFRPVPTAQEQISTESTLKNAVAYFDLIENRIQVKLNGPMVTGRGQVRVQGTYWTVE